MSRSPARGAALTSVQPETWGWGPARQKNKLRGASVLLPVGASLWLTQHPSQRQHLLMCPAAGSKQTYYYYYYCSFKEDQENGVC